MSRHPDLKLTPDSHQRVSGENSIQIAGTLTRLGLPHTGLWHQVLDNLFTFVAVMSRDGTVLDVNQAALHCTNLLVDDVVGRRLWECYWWSDSDAARRSIQTALATAANGEFIRRELTFQLTGSQQLTIDGAFAPLRDARGKVVAILGSGVDVSKRERAESALLQAHRDLLMLSASTQSVVRISDEAELLSTICQTIVDVGGYTLAWIGLAEQDESRSVRMAAMAGGADYLKDIYVTWDSSPTGLGPTGRAIREGQVCICKDTRHDPAFWPWRTKATASGFTSSIALPLVVNGVAVGALNIYSDRVDAFDPNETRLLKHLADDLGYGITALRKRLEHEGAEKRIERLTRVLRMQSCINAAVPRLRRDELLQEVCRVATELAGYDRAVYWGVNPESQTARRLYGFWGSRNSAGGALSATQRWDRGPTTPGKLRREHC